jgi:hypothetical protein
MPSEAVEGSFWHHPGQRGEPRHCSSCRDPRFRHGYEPFGHAHWAGGEGGRYLVCRCRGLPPGRPSAER